ncbi:hypothetical protein bpmyx0001_48280 [Bacillus pseudomycoides DSM 12442]|nr:hypothetical protein bpmyx0001_48280 [Bacillus pseudomycoides DSM 12442]
MEQLLVHTYEEKDPDMTTKQSFREGNFSVRGRKIMKKLANVLAFL